MIFNTINITIAPIAKSEFVFILFQANLRAAPKDGIAFDSSLDETIGSPFTLASTIDESLDTRSASLGTITLAPQLIHRAVSPGFRNCITSSMPHEGHENFKDTDDLSLMLKLKAYSTLLMINIVK